MQVRIVLFSWFVAAAAVLGAAPVALAQVNWSFEEIAVPPGPPGSWDSSRHQLGDVVFDGTTYHMFLVGGQTPLSWDSPWSVGHWTWNALTQEWDEDPANPVLSPEPGEWDGYTIYSVAVLYHEGVFKMWYGAAVSYPGAIYVGYATSLDGRLWIKDPANPLPSLAPGVPGEWDDGGWHPGTVLFGDAIYRMWSFAVKNEGAPYGTWRIGYATSPDGIVWAKHPEPVLVGNEPWEGGRVYFPEVVPMGGGYAMWYSGFVSSTSVASIGYAVSPDGLHWGKWPGNPVLLPLPGCNAVDSFAAILDGNTVHAWTTNCYDINYVTSPLEVVFFDAFETGDCAIWSSVVP